MKKGTAADPLLGGLPMSLLRFRIVDEATGIEQERLYQLKVCEGTNTYAIAIHACCDYAIDVWSAVAHRFVAH